MQRFAYNKLNQKDKCGMKAVIDVMLIRVVTKSQGYESKVNLSFNSFDTIKVK